MFGSNRINYTKTDIQTWVALPNTLETWRAQVTTNEQQLPALRQSLQELINNRLTPARELLNKLIAKLELPTIPSQILSLSQKIEDLEQQATPLAALIAETTTATTLARKERDRTKRLISIKDSYTQIAQINQNIETCNWATRKDEEAIRATRNSLLLLTPQIANERNTIRELECERDSLLARMALYRYEPHHHGHSFNIGGAVFSSGSSPSIVHSSSHAKSIITGTLHLGHHHHHPELATLQRQVSELDADIASHQGHLSELNRSANSINSKLNILERDIGSRERNIQSNQAEIQRLERQLANNHDPREVSLAHSSNLSDLNAQLRSQEAELSPLESKLRELQDQQSLLRSKIMSQQDKVANLQYRQNECIALIQDRSLSNDTAQLEQQRAEQERLLTQFENEEKQLKTEIVDLEKKIRADKNKIKENEPRVINQFLNLLCNNPQSLLKDLQDNIYSALWEFSTEHPYNNSITIRKALAELQTKIPVLSPTSLDPLEAGAARNRYYLLCGFIQQLIINLGRENILAETIISKLQKHDIDFNEAKNDYLAFKKQYHFSGELDELSDAQLSTIEKNNFDYALNAFNDSLARVKKSNLASLKQVIVLGQEIVTNLTKKRAANNFDYSYYTQLLHLSTQLLTPPPDLNDPNYLGLQQAYRNLVKHHPSEAPSAWFKGGGIFLMFLGAVIAAGAALVGLLGLPFAAPVYITAPVGGAGVALFSIGLGFFCHSRKKGLPGKLKEFGAEADKQKMALAIAPEKAAEPHQPGSYPLETPLKQSIKPSAPPLEDLEYKPSKAVFQ